MTMVQVLMKDSLRGSVGVLPRIAQLNFLLELEQTTLCSQVSSYQNHEFQGRLIAKIRNQLI
jgi:hypothetical protein